MRSSGISEPITVALASVVALIATKKIAISRLIAMPVGAVRRRYSNVMRRPLKYTAAV